MILVVGGPSRRGHGWVAWLVADLGERVLWVETAERAVLFQRAESDPPALLVAAEADLLTLRGDPILAGVPAVLVGATVARARTLHCLGALTADAERAQQVAGVERVLARLRRAPAVAACR